MIKTRAAKAIAAAAAVAAGVFFAVASPAQPAVAFFSGGLFLDAVPQSPATLVARGAAVDVPVEVTCNATEFAFLSVSVTERVGSVVTNGSTFTQPGCTGGHQIIVVRVSAFDGKAFAKGEAVATADLFGCLASPPFTCGEEIKSVTITIKK